MRTTLPLAALATSMLAGGAEASRIPFNLDLAHYGRPASVAATDLCRPKQVNKDMMVCGERHFKRFCYPGYRDGPDGSKVLGLVCRWMPEDLARQ